MTPPARAAAAIGILDAILAGRPAEAALLDWARSSRFAGSGDRAAVRDLVFDALRRRRSHAARGGGDTGRGLILGGLREAGIDPDLLFTGDRHAPPPLSPAEREGGRAVSDDESTDLPDWAIARLARDLGSGFADFAAAMRDRAPVWLRTNIARTTPDEAVAALAREGIGAVSDARLPQALRVIEGTRRIQGSAAYRDGLVELQDLSPQMACAALEVAPGLRVLDYCAGGGGKSLALAARGARVTAWDADQRRMRDLPARAERAGVHIARAPAAGPRGTFALVVADVPCSGSGTWRRTPDAKWRADEAVLAGLLPVQDGILDAAAEHVAPGGDLAYMTCSVITAENEDRVAAFLARDSRFALVCSRRLLPPEASDGFFFAKMRRLTDR